jgi:glycine betaine/proline transport system substrate-binding protein
VYTVVTKEFADKSTDMLDYLNNRGFTNADMNQLLAWMENEQANSEDAMYYFLETYPDVWKAWVPASVAEKVEAEL